MSEVNINNYRQIKSLDILQEVLDYNTVQDFEPDIRMVDATTLWVEESYQRSPTKKSLRLVKKIISDWKWTSFKSPIVTEVDGFLCVLDGQHTAIAAATHPHIKLIPVFVVETTDVIERAKSFIELNTNNTKITDIQLFKARLEAGEDLAVSVNMALVRAGVKLGYAVDTKERVVSAIGSLESICKNYGTRQLRMVLDVCVAAKLEPINKHYMDAVSKMLYDPKYKKDYDLQAISLVIRDYPYAQLCADIEFRSKQENRKRHDLAYELISARYISKFGEPDAKPAT